ncbi:phosphate signaling complex protein PhoU [Microbulbifer thermotolerans]|uniref:Phosphate-specific transport system accessory protein PhoU n=1 Tax=Microbulbifer thermotolerans TaxID=252514 RepID=A0A143HR60_MICTH|nr:phosphate signaling complex protein PhoU [Microbulbifer thermotolerans]AMX03890.1 transcriptional regulator PhoU [Microbulbifer thermotolerans]MCX2778592.1 phosphate signaling complex protein PhoU [Microbulbifer thermotolerans]MCX2782862.1 phosphate signaling complex protein PhoU [Microbulbifer thermotolerans]MCX2794068.1 phosphate signaling complex protein PhoU [Microbulbifer thermotolerans]MCX2802963.1 phosphate signaling complex protein PhoU [Microbulbifer thermotolerans]
MEMHFDQHISRQFNEDLESIKTEMLEMGGLVARQVADAVDALSNADSELAEKVLRAEEEIDKREMALDEHATLIIAKRQPAASDLRMVMSVTRIARDLERIGDEASKVAKMAIALTDEGSSPRGYTEIRHIANAVRKMLNDALDAYTRFDVIAAMRTLTEDEKVDMDYRTAVRELITYMMEDPRSISRVINVLWILRSLERIGDHAKNICEQVVYLVEGADIRHGHEDKLKTK